MSSRKCKFGDRRIPQRDSNILWGRSAGRCASPGCLNVCIDTYEQAGVILLGEMAHVIGHSSQGPRGVTRREAMNSYENLILLCPYHHTLVDKAPDDFPEHVIRNWKAELEQRVSQAVDLPKFSSKHQLFEFASKIMAENRVLHDHFGPCSITARRNPLSNMVEVWNAKKLQQIIPNNTVVVAAFERFRNLLSNIEISIYEQFRAHVISFEQGAGERLDGVPRFPTEFATMLDGIPNGSR